MDKDNTHCTVTHSLYFIAIINESNCLLSFRLQFQFLLSFLP